METMRRAHGAGKTRARRVAGIVRGRVASPFVGTPPPLVVHCCHHKVGTVWFEKVLRAVGTHYGLPYEHLDGPPAPTTRLALQHHTRVDLATFGPFVGSHMIRDPRDVAVSGYHYHLWTDEPAIVAPDPAYGGRSHQEVLRSLDRDAGLLAEIRRACTRAIAEMAAWNYDDPRFVEIRYEDAITDEGSTFARLFRHYGFGDRAVDAAVEVAARYSFQQVERRAVGRARDGRHLRSAAVGQWREALGPSHRDLFKELAGDVIVALGYETDDRW